MAAISVNGATIVQAQAALDVWQAVPAAANARDDRAGRVLGMRTDMAAFAKKIAVVVTDVAPDLAPLAPETALKQCQSSACANKPPVRATAFISAMRLTSRKPRPLSSVSIWRTKACGGVVFACNAAGASGRVSVTRNQATPVTTSN